MLVGNKSDMRDTATLEGRKCVPGHFGEKLAMVRTRGPRWERREGLSGSGINSLHF